MRSRIGKVFLMNTAFIGSLTVFFQPACSLCPDGIVNRIISPFKKIHQVFGVKSRIPAEAQLTDFAIRRPVRNSFEDFCHDRFGFIGRIRTSPTQPSSQKSAGIVFVDDKRMISRLLVVMDPGRPLLIAIGIGFC